MDIVCRPARLGDLDPAARIVQRAYNDLRARHGLAPTVPLRPPLFQRFCLAEDPEGLWVAEAGGAVVGFGCAWTRQKFWYLAQLFTEPGAQAKGVGQALLSRTLEHAERNGAENRALITMAYNTASTGLYVRNGLCPREPLFRVAAPASALARRIAGAAEDHEAAPMAPCSSSGRRRGTTARPSSNSTRPCAPAGSGTRATRFSRGASATLSGKRTGVATCSRPRCARTGSTRPRRS